jgi:hypothetical protein
MYVLLRNSAGNFYRWNKLLVISHTHSGLCILHIQASNMERRWSQISKLCGGERNILWIKNIHFIICINKIRLLDQYIIRLIEEGSQVWLSSEIAGILWCWSFISDWIIKWKIEALENSLCFSSWIWKHVRNRWSQVHKTSSIILCQNILCMKIAYLLYYQLPFSPALLSLIYIWNEFLLYR